MNNLIAITGSNGVGKDTVGRIIQFINTAVYEKGAPFEEWDERVGLDGLALNPYYIGVDSDYEIKKFADAVTTTYKEITGINFHKCSREEKEEHRAKYIEYAETCKKIFGDSVWVDRLFTDYLDGAGKVYKSYWIITDLRFPIEFRKVKELGGTVIEVRREGMKSGVMSNFDVDFVIDNNGSVEELIEKCKLIKNNLDI